MNTKITLLATFLTILPVMATASSLTKASEVLYSTGTSFVVKTVGTSVSVTTFNYKTPDETCKMLKNSGIPVVSVKNWKEDGSQVSKTC